MKHSFSKSFLIAVTTVCAPLALVAAEPATLPVATLSAVGTPIATRPALYGQSMPAIDWHGSGNKGPLVWSSELNGPDPSWLVWTQAYPLHVFRLHMGNLYPWKQSVGPLAQRQGIAHDKWSATYRSEAGLDEFLRWVEQLPQPTEASLIASPLRPVEELADLVAYCNATSGPMAEWRAANGHPKPYGVKIWEMGNEVDWLKRQDEDVKRSDSESEKKERITAAEYIRLCRERIEAMRRVDSTIRIYAHAQTAPWFETNPTWRGWHRDVIRELGGLIDGVVIHLYYDGYSVPTCLKSIDALIADIHELEPKGRQLTVWVNEHSRWVHFPKRENWPQSWSLQGAISSTDFLLQLMARPDVSMANYWSYIHRGPWRVLNANWEEDGTKKFPTAPYYVFQLLNAAKLPSYQLLQVALPSEASKAKPPYSYVVTAGLFRDPASNKRVVVAVNRSARQGYRLALPAEVGDWSGPVKRWSIVGANLDSTNVPATPEAVSLKKDEVKPVKEDFGRWSVELPPGGVTAWFWES